MSIREGQREVLREEIGLMTALEEVAAAYPAQTPLGQRIRDEWCGTFVHYRRANEIDIADTRTQKEFDDALDEEEKQLNDFLEVIIKTKHHGGWEALFNQELRVIETLRKL